MATPESTTGEYPHPLLPRPASQSRAGRVCPPLARSWCVPSHSGDNREHNWDPHPRPDTTRPPPLTARGSPRPHAQFQERLLDLFHLLPPDETRGQVNPPHRDNPSYDLGIKRWLQKRKMTWSRRAMIFYRSRQNWLPRNLFVLDPGKLVLFICNYTQWACYQSLSSSHPPPPRKRAQRNILNLRQKPGRSLGCLSGFMYVSVWALWVLIILLKFWVLI